MPHRAFFAFILPSLAAMVLFIFVPLLNVGYTSFFSAPPPIQEVSEICQRNFITGQNTCTETVKLVEVEGPDVFRGLFFFCNRSVLACEQVANGADLMNLPFYKAMAFTLFYTVITLPFVLIFGLTTALAVDNIPRLVRGPTIFATLLPFIVTPLVGSLVLFWMTDNNGGVLYSLINWLAFWSDDFSLRSSVTATWATIAIYGVWSVTPFAFIVFYAALQTVSKDQIEAAMIDGAPKWDRFRYVILPHLMPLVTFVILMHIMDAFRVLEPIVSFNARGNAQSVSFLIFDYLVGPNGQRFGSAASTSVLTMVIVFIMLFPVLVRTWRDFRVASR